MQTEMSFPADSAGTTLRALVHASPLPIVGLDPDGLVLVWNPAAERVFGWTADEIAGRPYPSLPEGEEDAHRTLRQRTLAGEAITGVEVRRRCKDGSIVDARLSTAALRDGSGSVIGAMAIMEDVTDQKHAEEALRQSEERFRAIFDSARLGIVVTSPEGHVVESNRAFRSMVGYSEQELAVMPFSAYTHPDDLGLNLELFEELRVGARDSYELVKRLICKDGNLRWVHLTTSRVSDSEGRPVLMAVVDDVTEQRQSEEALRASEERYRELFENAHDLMFTFGLDGRYVAVSLSVERILGYAPEELVGRHFSVVMPMDSAELAREQFARKLSADADTTTYELDLLAKDGSCVPAEVTSRSIRRGDEIVGFQGVARDLRERRALELQLRQAQKMEAVGQLAGGIAHDFNNLLTAVSGYSELLLAKLAPSDPLRRDAEEIRKAGERAAVLTRQLLAFSRRQVLQPKVVDVNDVIQETEAMLRRLIGEHIELETKPSRKLARVRADPGQLGQVIVNLAVNARDAMPDGGRLTIETANVKMAKARAARYPPMPPGAYVRLAVTDTGVGMDAETRARVFEPFFTTKELGSGTGLGLATVYGIVKQSDGFVFATSEPDSGSTFEIFLPSVEDEAEAAAEALRTSPLFGEETILLVEDEDVVRELVREILEANGYSVLEAAQGEEAIAICRGYDGPIDVLLTDVVMPRMGGRELAERVGNERPRTRILFMSGYTQVGFSGQGGLPAGVAFIQKPFSPTALAARVRDVLDEPAQPARLRSA